MRFSGVVLLIAAAVPMSAWHLPHKQITRAAYDSLPEAMRQRWRSEAGNILERYCWYPDWFEGSHPQREAIRPYVQKPDGQIIHNITWDAEQDVATLEILLSAIARHTRAGAVEHAAKYAGVLAHFLEDSTCPAHAMMPQDPGLNLVKDLLGLAGPRDASLHTYLERTAPEFDLGGRAPARLAGSVSDAAKMLLVRCYASIRGIRAGLLELVRAADTRDEVIVNRHRRNAEIEAAKLLADAWFTAILLGDGSRSLEP